jgi:hypothetical protein
LKETIENLFHIKLLNLREDMFLIYMMKIVEKDGITINNPFPLRTDIIQKHIRIDTTTLVHTIIN